MAGFFRRAASRLTGRGTAAPAARTGSSGSN